MDFVSEPLILPFTGQWDEIQDAVSYLFLSFHNFVWKLQEHNREHINYEFTNLY